MPAQAGHSVTIFCEWCATDASDGIEGIPSGRVSATALKKQVYLPENVYLFHLLRRISVIVPDLLVMAFKAWLMSAGTKYRFSAEGAQVTHSDYCAWMRTRTAPQWQRRKLQPKSRDTMVLRSGHSTLATVALPMVAAIDASASSICSRDVYTKMAQPHLANLHTQVKNCMRHLRWEERQRYDAAACLTMLHHHVKTKKSAHKRVCVRVNEQSFRDATVI